jgi:Spy/CpxP family protein refolding chaperone
MSIMAKTAILIVCATLAAACAANSHEHGSPYAGQQSRAVKALSNEELNGYLAGAGMGFAKAAELNRYPGPMHALENEAALDLTTSQRDALADLMRRHKEEARALGAEVVRLEGELDALFAQKRATADAVDRKLAEIGTAQARVRGSHLKTHIEATALLTPAQVERYVVLRGY